MFHVKTWKAGLLVVWFTTYLWTVVLAQERVQVSESGRWHTGPDYDYSQDASATASFTIPRNTPWDRVVITAQAYALTGPGVYTPKNFQVYLNGIPYRTGTPEGTTLLTSELQGRTSVTIGVALGSGADGLMLYKVEAFTDAISTSAPPPTFTSAVPTNSSTTSSTTSRSASTISNSSDSTSSLTSTTSSTPLPTSLAAGASTVDNPSVSFSPGRTTTIGGGSSIAAANDSASSANSKRTSTIVGVVLGLLAFAALCVFLVMWYRRKVRKDRIPPSTAYMNYRSTTTEPPVYGFAPSRGGIRELKGVPADRETLYADNAAGLGAHGTGNWGKEKTGAYGYGAIPGTRGNYDGAMASLPWPAPPSAPGANGMMPGQYGKPLPPVAPSALMYQQHQQPNANPFSGSHDPIITTTGPPTHSQDSALGGPIARTLTPDPDRSSRGSEAYGDMNPYGGIALGVMPMATNGAPAFPTAGAPAASQPTMSAPATSASALAPSSAVPAQNVPNGLGGMPLQPQQAMGNPFLGPTEANFAGRGAGHWNQTNNA